MLKRRKTWPFVIRPFPQERLRMNGIFCVDRSAGQSCFPSPPGPRSAFRPSFHFPPTSLTTRVHSPAAFLGCCPSSQVYVDENGDCVYPHSPSLILGVVAALVLLVAQILVTVVGGCVCCSARPPSHPNSSASSNRSVAIICLVACWITFLNAFALLMAGTTVDDQRHQYMWFSDKCSTVKPLVFAGGSLLALATVVLDVIYYLASCAAKASARNAAQELPQEIALGQAYPGNYVPSLGQGQGQAYYYPYGPYHPYPSHQQSADPNAPLPPPMGYPVAPGVPPKSPPPTNAT